MKLKRFLEAADGQITSGSEYQWKCYGENARYIDVSNIDNQAVGSAIFDSKTKKVYEVTAEVNEDNVVYRWIDLEYKNALREESVNREVDWLIAYDNVAYTDCDDDEILDLLHKIIHKTYVHEHYHRPLGESLESAIENNERVIQEQTPEKEFKVKITVVHEFDVKAHTMEKATEKAKEFVSGFKPINSGLNQVCWLDTYNTKEEVARNLVSETYEE